MPTSVGILLCYHLYMNTRTLGIFALCTGASLLAGFYGSTATVPNITTWYATLVRPVWTPPNWLFMPVWSILYVLMGSAVALVWTSKRKKKLLPVAFFFAHLVLNVSWSIVFFGNHDPRTALFVIGALWLSILVMMIWYWRYSRLATYLLVPYIVWVSYASTLNLGIVILNP